ADTCLTLQEQADVAAQSMALVIANWKRMDPDQHGLTCAEVIRRLTSDPEPPPWYDEMRQALEELCGKLTANAIGYKLREYARRNFDGSYIDQAGRKDGSVRWAVYEATNLATSKTSPGCPASPSSQTGDQGDTGDVSTAARYRKFTFSEH